MTVKKIKLQELQRKIPKMYINEAMAEFNVSYRTIKEIASKLGLKFKKYKPAGRKKIQLI